MALIWLRRFELKGDIRYVNAALKALDLVKLAQPMSSGDTGIRGGIPGSFPVWGAYISNTLPNWAAKFFVDGLLAKKRVLKQLATRHRQPSSGPGGSGKPVPMTLPALQGSAERPQKLVMYTRAVFGVNSRHCLNPGRNWGSAPLWSL